MPLDPALFRPEAISEETAAFNKQLLEMMAGVPATFELTPAEARAQSESRFSQMYPRDEEARNITIAGPRGELELRVYEPAGQPDGVYLHFHGSGFVVFRPHHFDFLNRAMVEATNVVVVSVYYGLGPEDPYPAAFDDGEYAGLWIAKNAAAEFGTSTLVIGGESAGGELAAATLLRLRDKHDFTGFAAANLIYGGYGAGWTPSILAAKGNRVLGLESIEWFMKHAFNGRPYAELASELPLAQDLRGLPPALFTIGTLDALLDDNLYMYGRWIAAGNEAEFAAYPGGLHGFDLYPTTLAADARKRMYGFIRERIRGPVGVR